MTITDTQIRAALDRTVLRGELDRPLPGLDAPALVRARHRAGRVPALVVAAVVVALVGAVAIVGTVARSDQQVRTQSGGGGAPAPAPTAPASAAGVTAPVPSSLRLAVLLGGADAGAGASLAEGLAEAGYQVAPVGRARFDGDITSVYFAPGNEIAGQDLAVRLAVEQARPLPVRPLAASGSEDADLVVVLGRASSPGSLVEPAAGATYQATTTSPVPYVDPDLAIWRGTAADAAERATPEGTVRALFAAVDPTIGIDDVTVTPGAMAGWMRVTARVGGTVFIEVDLMPDGGGWLPTILVDVDHPAIETYASLPESDPAVIVAAPVGTASVRLVDLDLDPPRAHRFREAATPVPLADSGDSTITGFRFEQAVASGGHSAHLAIGRSAAGTVTTVQVLLR
jgi:hypothetical protein